MPTGYERLDALEKNMGLVQNEVFTLSGVVDEVTRLKSEILSLRASSASQATRQGVGDENWSTLTLQHIAQILEQPSGTLAQLEDHARAIMAELKGLRK